MKNQQALSEGLIKFSKEDEIYQKWKDIELKNLSSLENETTIITDINEKAAVIKKTLDFAKDKKNIFNVNMTEGDTDNIIIITIKENGSEYEVIVNLDGGIFNNDIIINRRELKHDKCS